MYEIKKINNLMNKVFKKPKDIIIRKIENELIIFPLRPEEKAENNYFFCLNDPTSFKTWSLIDGKITVEQIINKISKIFNVKKDKIKYDIVNFIQKLKKNSLIIEKK